MKTKKLLAFLLTLSILSPSVIAANDTTTTDTTLHPNDTFSTNFAGTIKPTQIKVTVPTNVPFDIDPTIEVWGAYSGSEPKSTAQVTDPGNATITNSSDIPIWIRVSRITTDSSIELVNSAADLQNKQVMFGLKEGAPAELTTPSDWLVGTGEDKGQGTISPNYFLNSNGKLESGAAITMKILGVTRKGWEAENSFTVTPIFTVSVTNPGA